MTSGSPSPSRRRAIAMLMVLAVIAASVGRASAAPSPPIFPPIFLGGAKLPLTTPANGSWFGGPLASNGDGTLLVAGAPLRTFAQPGVVHVFSRSQTSEPFAQVATLRASDGGDLDRFGSSVAVSADGSTIVAGRVTIAATYVGTTVYVFARPPTGWASATETARLTTTTLAATDAFGWEVAVSGDGGTVAASILGDSAVNIFTRPAQGWGSATQTARLTTAESGHLRATVALSRDGSTVAAGGDDGVYVFVRPDAGWADATETVRIDVSLGNNEAGHPVVVSADGRVIATSDAAAPMSVGSVYVFERGGSWADRAGPAILPGQYDDYLGHEIAISDDGRIIAASAYGADLQFTLEAGAALLFARAGSSWASGAAYERVAAPVPRQHSHFGVFLTLSGDAGTLVAGGYDDPPDSMSADLGVAYVFAPATERACIPIVAKPLPPPYHPSRIWRQR